MHYSFWSHHRTIDIRNLEKSQKPEKLASEVNSDSQTEMINLLLTKKKRNVQFKIIFETTLSYVQCTTLILSQLFFFLKKRIKMLSQKLLKNSWANIISQFLKKLKNINNSKISYENLQHPFYTLKKKKKKVEIERLIW